MQQKFQSPGGGSAVHRPDDGLRHGSPRSSEGRRTDVLAGGSQFAEVESGAECRIATGEHHRPDIIGCVEPGHHVAQARYQCRCQRVPPLGSIENDNSDGAFRFDCQSGRGVEGLGHADKTRCAAVTICSSPGTHDSSSDGAYGAGVNGAPTRTTGASRFQKPSSTARAATSAPTPKSLTAS